jgi:predicted 3-demethylubiquinone-9 3-methyltransferase (glyoxalase superfamily)
MRDKVQRITPFLWFDNEAEEAVNFYVSIFKNSKIRGTPRRSPDCLLSDHSSSIVPVRPK